MWLLPIIRPLPDSGGNGSVEWLSLVIVIGALTLTAAVVILTSLRGKRDISSVPHPEHRDKAA